MPYLAVALAGGLLTLLTLKGCEKSIEMIFSAPKTETPIEKMENGKIIKNSLLFSAGAISAIGAVFIAKKIFEK